MAIRFAGGFRGLVLLGSGIDWFMGLAGGGQWQWKWQSMERTDAEAGLELSVVMT